MSRTPVIHLSATFVKDIDKVQGLEGGADGYLTHPVEPPVLIATVNAFLRAREADRVRRQRELEIQGDLRPGPQRHRPHQQRICCSSKSIRRCPRSCKSPRDSIVPQIDARLHAGRIVAKKLWRFSTASSAERTWRGIFPLRAADGKTVYLDWNLSRHSAPGRWLAVVSDITSRLAIGTRAGRAPRKRAGGPDRRRTRQSSQGRLSGDALARAADTAQCHRRLGGAVEARAI